ncbi:acetyltransferase (GNAT) family protein [Paenibacillus cellulosilyticus]|uniref:Acetyltransferase (GNAT) family protein n=1 Tax=Paenibacillus cellulosilyticus TaxID=375489 RepID=A0A2V2YMT1_9BACL|nr:GNAT family N-acetyltransferase [Paenibacillus cellulosilyticus]PWV95878.1 acetyltransferase (GNAT) family protein [Paenibacillus cellulosilyticus]QKS47748.1 GNAT family N-acetyltransferase [Paenibacillus cellulosilyticus]
MVIDERSITDIQHLVNEYLEGLSSPFDSFLEEHILSSTFYLIQKDDTEVGYFAVHNHDRLTQFYIRRAYLKHAQPLFLQVLERYSVRSLFVPTCDELLLSLTIDQGFKINKQAYFFQDSGVDQPELVLRDGEIVRAAVPNDLPVIEQVCGGFLEDYSHWINKGEMLVYYRDQDLLGIGLLEKSRMLERHASIGMFTNVAYRRQGIGKTIIMQLRRWCKEQGLLPLAGCWYYNDESKKTLESGGMVTRTRLLHIDVTPHDQTQ